MGAQVGGGETDIRQPMLALLGESGLYVETCIGKAGATCAPRGHTPVNLRMQALTAARFDDILAHVSFTGTGSKDSRLYPLWDQTRIWDPGD